MSQIFDVLNSIKQIPIVCIGDVMFDSFISGKVERISPEAPVPILKIEHREYMLGGVGNVYSNLLALGADPYLISVIGKDDTGFQIWNAFDKNPKVMLIDENDRISTMKTRFRSGNQQLLRVDEETSDPIKQSSIDKILQELGKILPNTKAVIISDYNKGVISGYCTDIIELAHQYNNVVLVDPKGKEYMKYFGADVITPNLKELTEINGRSFSNVQNIIDAATNIRNTYDIKNVVVKRGENGIIVVNDKVTEIKSKKREVFDVSGAGDTVISTLASVLASGYDIELAAEIANMAGGIVVTKQNTATVSMNDIINDVQEKTQEKIIYGQTLTDDSILTHLKYSNKKIGFTNGCFDLLHAGHIETLKQARSFCDYLIVGLNSDASVKRLKGESRPILDEASRATVLSALEYVDLVIIFNEDTPLELIRKIAPNVLVKGSDYSIENIVGGDYVKENGGEVKFVTLAPGFSTTNIIKKIQDSPN